LNDFLRLAPLLNEGVALVLVGLNEEQLKDLPINVIGISRTENTAQLVEIYSAADLFLNLTYEDTFPTTNLESLACGTPVLTYNTGGSTESVTSDTGFVVEKGDLSGVLDVIRMFKDKGKSAFVKACRNRSEKLYNKNDRYNEYFALYEKLLSQKVEYQ
jgi:glycosyltransferase involved in cell wall biosynthesis